MTQSKNGLQPVIDDNTEILILGTMPSDKSIEVGEYYANPTNQFWKIILRFLEVEENTEISYKEKCKLLLKNKIGLWDTLSEAVRKGSLDQNIQKEKFNDFSKLFIEYPNLKVLIFNGKKPAEFFKKSEYKYKGNLHTLPSTSSANTGTTLENKKKIWIEILKEYRK